MLADGGGSVLVVGGGLECSASFSLETSFSLVRALIGFDVTWVVPTSVGWVATGALGAVVV